MNISEQQIQQVISKVMAEMAGTHLVPIEASARHVHLSQADVDLLFGEGYQLTPKRELSQPGQYLCEERISLIGPKGSFQNVAVLGPVRPDSQVELSRTDSRTIGVKAPIRESGDVAGTPGLVMVGPKGVARIESGVIVARNHIHMTSADALRMGVQDKELVSIKVGGDRPVTFHNVVVRVKDSFALAMHIDYDEANAVELARDAQGELVRN